MCRFILLSQAMPSSTENKASVLESLQQQISHYVQDSSLIIGAVSSLFTALLIFFIGRKVAKVLATVVQKGLVKADNPPILAQFIANIVRYTLLVVVIIMALSELGVKTGSALTIFGAAGLAVGLALKDSLSNFASGAMLALFRPFAIGDTVEVAGVSGKVKDLRIFSTILLTFDNKEVIIPNGQITSDIITNYSSQPNRRIDLVIGVSYDDDLKLAQQTMQDVLDRHPLVISNPASSVALTELGGSSVDFTVRAWVQNTDYGSVRSELLAQLKEQLEAAGCSFPYPQNTVHLRQS